MYWQYCKTEKIMVRCDKNLKTGKHGIINNYCKTEK
jgi:hypothetical protein